MTSAVQSEWIRCSAAKLCPICTHSTWCQISCDDAVVICMREARGAWQSKTLDDGSVGHFHRLRPSTDPQHSDNSHPKPGKADADTLNRVYTAMLGELGCCDSHRADLIRRKATPESTPLYRSLPIRGRPAIAKKLAQQFSEATLLTVPGFVRRTKNGKSCLTIAGSAGLLVPVRDEHKRIIAVKIRPDDSTDGKYKWLTSASDSGPSPGSPPHCPRSVPVPSKVVRLTEGPMKADISTGLNCLPTVAADSVSNTKPVVALLKAIGCETTRLAFDGDWKTNGTVAASTVRCFDSLTAAGIAVEFETWPDEFKGIDDALAAGVAPTVLTGEAVDAHLQKLRDAATVADDRLEIEITTEEHKVNDAAIEGLSRDDSIYHRAGSLVQIIHDAEPTETESGIRRPEDAPRIAKIKQSTLRERLTRFCRFVKLTDDGCSPRHPPQWCVLAIAERGTWRGIRKLTGIVSAPILRRDGTIFNTPGYDPATGLIFDPGDVTFSIPDAPTIEDARAAADLLLALIEEFPIQKPEHRSAWLSFTITPLVRHAFDGPAPLFLFDANTPGSGKTLLAECASLIVTGRDFARMSNPSDDNEARKRITAIAIDGDPLVLIDNLTQNAVLGCASLDAALTATVWKDRLLGHNTTVEIPLTTVWAASGNNVMLGADTSRRVCHIRLESPEENPEERSGFTHPNLAQYIRDNRPALLSAALTIPLAFCRAGRPSQNLKHWGSFEGWSGLVRESIVWTGLADPGETRKELVQHSDSSAAAIRGIITNWKDIDQNGDGLTAAEAIERLSECHDDLSSFSGGFKFPKLRTAVIELCGDKAGKLPSPRSLGNRLRRLRGRVVGGQAITCREDRDGVMVWSIQSCAGSAGLSESVLIRRGENSESNELWIEEKRVELAETDPAEPADPALWLQHVPTVTVSHHGELQHRSPSCGACKGWRFSGDGRLYCLSCWPPPDLSGVRLPGPPQPPSGSTPTASETPASVARQSIETIDRSDSVSERQ